MQSSVRARTGRTSSSKRPSFSPSGGPEETSKHASCTNSPSPPRPIMTSLPPANVLASMPDWARVMYERSKAQYNNLTQQISGLRAAIEAVLARTTAVEDRIDRVEHNVEAIHQAQEQHDTHEARFSGLPANCLQDEDRMMDAINRILRSINCQSVIPHIMQVRKWDRSLADGSAGGAAAAMFVAAAARDRVVAASS